MARLQLVDVSAETPLPPPRLRLLSVSGAGVGQSVPNLRLLEVSASGQTAIVVDAPTLATLGPGETLEVTASILYGLSDVTWSWRLASGPTVSMVGTGATRQITAPHLWPASWASPNRTVVIGITATVGPRVSPEHLLTLTILPQTIFTMAADRTMTHGAMLAPA